MSPNSPSRKDNSMKMSLKTVLNLLWDSVIKAQKGMPENEQKDLTYIAQKLTKKIEKRI